MFSKRTGWERAPNALAIATAAERDPALLDLTISNPTAIGIDPPPELLAALADPRGRTYAPEPFGLPSARRAVAEYYRSRNVQIDPERVILTSTTSEAYTFLFRLLLDPFDRVAAPTPSYPLFSFLAELADVERVAYPIDAPADAIAEAVIVVSLNNPTGTCLTPDARARLIARGRPVIADEVFLDYLIDPTRFSEHTFASEPGTLTFTLSGLSKVAGLPQLKLSWIVVSGPEALATEALARLEIIADTYLSVATPVQLALPACLDRAEPFQRALRARLAENRACLPANAQVGEGGWYAILPLHDAKSDDEAFALALLAEEKIKVHPGYFFDLASPAIVVSLLLDPRTFAPALARIATRIG